MKRIIIKLSPVLLLVITVTVMAQRIVPQQVKPDFDPYQFPDTLAHRNYDLDSLKAVIGDNKGLPKGFEIAAAIAYSAYPELKDVNIDMVLTDKGAPMEANFNIWSMLLPGKKNRKYKILLNNADKTWFDPILLRSLPFDAQVGILAHELGHIVYYHELNFVQIGIWGLKYVTKDEFHAIHERTTDLMPIYHGLGSQIYQYAYYVRKDPSCVSFYENGKDFMDTYYMTDEELLAEMKQN
ncbi:MAG: hypothetical protein JXR03_09965 [Cyclobacteriaceae bacterium]